ncbi:MAG: HAMP domain-containing histidine kinase [Deltaproteobacteria bacterium]|nr:HAMP domain-containing histidine kinase [Deltaproteobacteria bacterium]
MTDPPTLPIDADPDRYVEVARRLDRVNSVGAGVIGLLTILAVWNEPRLVLYSSLLLAVLLSFNIWVSRSALARFGRRVEILRAAVNLASNLAFGHAAHWPLPVWLWLPFVALAFDPIAPRVVVGILGTMIVAQATVALWDGVHWLLPFAFTALALFAAAVSWVRFGIIRQMLHESDIQRQDLARAHASIQAAHQQLQHEIAAREQIEAELRQAQKLEAMGRLAAGIAHEINTPMQFVQDCVTFVGQSAKTLLALAGRQRELIDGVAAAPLHAEADRAEAEAELPSLAVEVPEALAQAREGIDRISAIVRSMRQLAHRDDPERTVIDLNSCVQAALVIARHEYETVADLEFLRGELPPVRGHGGELTQVVLNLVVNASHAIADSSAGGARGRIVVATGRTTTGVEVRITDTGGGIPEAVRDRVFEPFFTTKEPGRGSGQGLAISRGIALRHGGSLSFLPAAGGTTFVLQLPTSPGGDGAA